MNKRWTPRATVAVVVEKDGKFLMVRERSGGREVFNQPAGHIEKDESILDAVRREALEETAWKIEPTAFLGMYILHAREKDVTYHRYAFVGEAHERTSQPIDDDILGTHWMTADELRARKSELRSPLVLKCVEDCLAGRHLPLETIYEAEA
ncbi:MAG: NUDIX hydrolase [Gammaproteobacteria bacterium]|nr:MAG: NUDIX hydrolase [Gammaproteobacteria bacterium]